MQVNSKVSIAPNGDYIKIFNPKSGFTKRHFFPKYKSFMNNARALNQLGVPCVDIKEAIFLPEKNAYAVRYKPLEGVDLRSLARENAEKTLLEFIPFLVSLHEKGIFFRGIHLGNVLKLKQGYGLIDMADLYCKRPPLSIFTRARNLIHLINNKDDKAFYQQLGIEKFIEGYLKESGITGLSARYLKFHTSSVQK